MAAADVALLSPAPPAATVCLARAEARELELPLQTRSSEPGADCARKRIEVIVDAELHQVHFLADIADPLQVCDAADLWGNIDRLHTGGHHVLRTEIEIIVFKLGGPVSEEGVLGADACQQAG